MVAWVLLLNFIIGQGTHSLSWRHQGVSNAKALSWGLPATTRTPASHMLLRMSSESPSASPETQEETLLCARLKVNRGVQFNDALQAVTNFCQSFPFAAVLPVQPLHYIPLEEHGVEVKFLRKKTDIKSGVDGGIRFYVTPSQTSTEIMSSENDCSDAATTSENPALDYDEDDHEELTDDGDVAVIEISAKRNSSGQVISKLMSEKLIVTKFVAELQQQQITAATTSKGGGVVPLQDAVTLTSVYHKWM